jgi:hypothetical protein
LEDLPFVFFLREMMNKRKENETAKKFDQDMKLSESIQCVLAFPALQWADRPCSFY